MTYDVSRAKFAIRILKNPKVQLRYPVEAQQLLDEKVDFVILRYDPRDFFQGDILQCHGFWYPWVGFSKKNPTGYKEKGWAKDLQSQNDKQVVTGWSNDLKAVPLAHVYFDSEVELQEWFGEQLWAELVMKLIV